MSKNESTRIPWASLAVVATFVSGTLIVPKAFDLLRPAEKERAQQFSGADLEVDARLWEDPFAAVRRHEFERVERCKNPAAATRRECDAAQRDARRAPAALRAHLDANADGEIDAQSTLLVAVLVPGNPFVGAEEARRRTRFALLAGLQAEGYYSDSAEQIGLMQVPLAPITALAPLTRLESRRLLAAAGQAAPPAKASNTTKAAATAGAAPLAPGGDQLLIPYELLSRNRNLRTDDAPAAPAALAAAAARPIAPAAAMATAVSAAAPPATPTAVPAAAARAPYRSVVVVWVDEAALPGPKLDGVARLLDTVIACRAQVCPRLAVIGPSSSDGLDLILHGLEAALIRRGQAPEFIDASLANGYRLLAQAHFFSPAATISDEDLPLLRGREGQTVPEFFTSYFTGIVPERARLPPGEREVPFTRTIGADVTVASLLAGEVLQRLPIDGKRRVVTIVESDSIYARGLERRLRHLLQHGSQIERIDQLYFFRGLDGVTVRDGTVERQPPSATKGRSKGGDGEADAVEWPEARDQLDYLRRMAEELKASERVSAERGGGPIGAIGIFANDVHDKLLVLQALHDTFPDKVFFTTDMDARFVHPRVLPFTRNLVVASSLPLKMPPVLQTNDGRPRRAAEQVQESTPPLRDVYQTATYLAARLASCTNACEVVNQATRTAIESPSVYEIGRNGAVAIGGHDAAAQREQRPGAGGSVALALGLGLVAFGLLVAPSTPAWRAARAAGRSVGPSPSLPSSWSDPGKSTTPASSPASGPAPRRLELSVPLLSLGYGAWLGLAAASVLETGAPGSLGLTGALAWSALGGAVALAVGLGLRRWLSGLALALALGAAAWLIGPALPGQGEPLGWLNGISGWPSHFLHLAAVLVVLVSFDLLHHRTRTLATDEAQWLGMPAAPSPSPAAAQPTRLWTTRWRRLADHALLRWPRWPSPAAGPLEFTEVWRRFVQLEAPTSRLVRVLFWYALTVAGASAVFIVLTGRTVPEVPVRGIEHRAIVTAGLVAALAALPALVLAVADSTLNTLRLLLALAKGHVAYPSEVHARFARELGPELESKLVQPLAVHAGRAGPTGPNGPNGSTRTLLDDWIGIRLVARRTQAVAPWIVAPFVALGLLVVARSRLFDSWAMTWPLALTGAAYLLGLVGLAVALKLGAERLRAEALARMRADLLWLGGAGAEHDKLAVPLKQLIAEVESNRTGAFAPMLEQPLVASLMVPLGTAGGVQLLDHLLLAR